MVHEFDTWMKEGRSALQRSGRLPLGKNQVKSYLIEANVDPEETEHAGLVAFLARSDFQAKALPTDDRTLHRVRLGRKGAEFWLDTLDPRFWILHTLEDAYLADQSVRSWVLNTVRLDAFWIPTRELQSWVAEAGVVRSVTAKFSVATGLYRDTVPDEEFLDESFVFKIGSSHDALIRWREYQRVDPLAQSLAMWSAKLIRRDAQRDLVAVDDVTAAGKVTARGDSFRLHQEVLTGLKNRYAKMIRDWEERYRLGWKATSRGGMIPFGEAVIIHWPASGDGNEAEALAQVLCSGAEPYRLYGLPVRQGPIRYSVRAVDLHTGDKIRMEIAPGFLRVYLTESACGNVIARLLTNLQHFHDARASINA
jgi:hypothetical protein